MYRLTGEMSIDPELIIKIGISEKMKVADLGCRH